MAEESFGRQPCLLCGAKNAKHFLSDPNGENLVRCPIDGFVFRINQPSDIEQQASFKSYIPSKHMYIEGRRPALAVYAQAIRKMKSAGKLVDVGCSVGTLFEFFPRENWQCIGIDPSEFNAEETNRLHGVQTCCGTLREAALPGGSVDVLTMLDTFPLVPNPRSELKESRRILKVGGIIGIEIEGWLYWNISSRGPICYLLKKTLLKLHPRQLHYYSNKNLVALLQSEGFRIVDRVLGPASSSRSALQKRVSGIHYTTSRFLYRFSGNRLSVAARELILAEKTT